MLALANIAPDECLSLYQLAKKGDLEAARKLQFRLLPVNQAVTAGFGIGGLKQAMDLLGLKGGDPRRPLEPLSPKQIGELTTILEEGGLMAKADKKG
ncbi:MAG: dihydrodipicolinate synthase family protein [Planctomycetota bacterium]